VSTQDRPSIAPDAPFAGLHVAMVVAHPDDEVLGAGGQFSSMRRLSLIHLTDGAPSKRAARWHGHPTRRAYSETRLRELGQALQSVGLAPDRFTLLLPDQQASFHLRQSTHRLAELLDRLRPDIVLTHPYEGGHPDHDAAAFAIAAALRLTRHTIPAWEFASYHASNGAMVTGAFLPQPATPVLSPRLSATQLAEKRRMLACFQSQQAIISTFNPDCERFRRAPAYDFTQPPHPGKLLYESRRRAWTGKHWRRRANAALLAPPPSPALVRRLYGQARALVWRAWLAI